LYYIERFRPDGSADQIREYYVDRSKSMPEFRLNLLALRIGRLGPEPGGLAVWTVPGFDSLERIARQLDGTTSPVELVTTCLYADIGSEIL
jgi:hypothetical protein